MDFTDSPEGQAEQERIEREQHEEPMTTAPKFVPDNNTPAAAPPEVPQWSEPMRYDVPQSNGCAGCPRLFVGTKWVGEICGAVYLGHNSVKYAERIVALWNDDIARHAPQPEAQPATETADEREANLSTEQVEQMLAESWKIIKNAEGNALPALPATGAASGVERFIVNNNSVSTPGNGSYGSKKYLGAGTTLVLAADHDRLLAERDGEIVELKQKLADEERRGDLHADLNKRVAEAVGNPFSGPGSSWHDLPEKVAALRTRAEAAEAALEKLRRDNDNSIAAYKQDAKEDHAVMLAYQRRSEAAEAKCAELELRLATSTESMYANMKTANEAIAQLTELRAERERMRALLTAHCDLLDQIWFHIPFTDVPAWDHKREKAINECLKAVLGNRRTGRTMLSRDEIRQQILPRLAAAETGVAK